MLNITGELSRLAALVASATQADDWPAVADAFENIQASAEHGAHVAWIADAEATWAHEFCEAHNAEVTK